MSADLTTLVMAYVGNVTASLDIGVYSYIADQWTQTATIAGTEEANSLVQLQLSADGERLAVSGINAGELATFDLSDGEWTRTNLISVDAEYEVFNATMSADGLTLALAAGEDLDVSYVQVYTWGIDGWAVLGGTLPAGQMLPYASGDSVDGIGWALSLTFQAGITYVTASILLGADAESDTTLVVYAWVSGAWQLVYSMSDSMLHSTGGTGSRMVFQRLSDATIGTVFTDWTEWTTSAQRITLPAAIPSRPILSNDESTMAVWSFRTVYVYRFHSATGVWISAGSVRIAGLLDVQVYAVGFMIAYSPNLVFVSADGSNIAVSNYRDVRVYAYGSAPCFHGTTPLALAGGGTVRASAVQPGMLLMDSHGQGQRVIRVQRTEDAPFVEIPVGVVGNTITLRVTPNHLLRVPGIGTVRADRALQLKGRSCEPAGQATVYHVGLRRWTFLPVCGIEAESWAWRAEDQAQRPSYPALPSPATLVVNKQLCGVRRRVRTTRRVVTRAHR